MRPFCVYYLYIIVDYILFNIDGAEGYHIGASFKDAGKKCFGINKIEGTDVINNLINKALQTSK